MSSKDVQTDFVDWRGELLAKMFLEDLKPRFVAEAAGSLEGSFDFMIGFENQNRGLNTYAVLVKATRESVAIPFPIDRDSYHRLVYSNQPVLLLVVNVKENVLYYHWPTLEMLEESGDSSTVQIPLISLNRKTTAKLREQLTSQTIVE